MRILITAGPTREYIDPVRFITNGSSGRMGYAVAAAAARRGHKVTLLSGPVALKPPAVGATVPRRARDRAGPSAAGACGVVPFVSVKDLAAAMRKHFPSADAVVMAAAVGDFRPVRALRRKLSRSGGPMTLRLVPTPDVLARAAARKRKGQLIFAFAVEQGPRKRIVAKALAEMDRKGADFVLLNTPAAMGAEGSQACILSPAGVVLPWARRAKAALAREIVRILEEAAGKMAGMPGDRNTGRP
jgi:phosphopantothenoylcysteine decarboxylase/phosphopantothenate--cysteine ligase